MSNNVAGSWTKQDGKKKVRNFYIKKMIKLRVAPAMSHDQP